MNNRISVEKQMMNASVAWFLLLALLWGSSFALIKVSLEGLTASQLVLSRLVLGAAVLLVIAGFGRIELPRSAGIWGHVAAAGLLGNVIPYLLLAYGEQATGAGIAGVFVGSTPLFTLALATAALPTERVTARKAIGLLVGFLGVVLVIGPWHDSPGSVSGWLACLGTALSYAASFVYVRKYLSPQELSPLALAASQLAAAAALQALAIPFLTWHLPRFTGGVTVSIIILGLLSTGFAYVLYFRLLGEVGATTASTVNYLVPVCALLVSVALLDEPVTWNVFVGGLVLLVAMAYADKHIKQPGRRSTDSTPPIPGHMRMISYRRAVGLNPTKSVATKDPTMSAENLYGKTPNPREESSAEQLITCDRRLPSVYYSASAPR